MRAHPRIYTYVGQPPRFETNPALQEAISFMRRQLDVLESLADQTILIPAGSRITSSEPAVGKQLCYVCEEDLYFDPAKVSNIRDQTGWRHEKCTPVICFACSKPIDATKYNIHTNPDGHRRHEGICP